MLRSERNKLELDGWVLEPIDSKDSYGILKSFDCGDSDLNEYFNEQALPNKAALLGRPYFLYDSTAGIKIPLALIDLCNDAVRKASGKKTPGYQEG